MAQAHSEDTKSKFFMLGIIHRDDRGAELLREWLLNIAPEVITLEFSNYGLTFRKERGGKYKKMLDEILNKMEGNDEHYDKEALSSLFSYINMPYEYEVSSRYAKEHNVSLYLIDVDAFSYLNLQKAEEELFEENNIKQLLCKSTPAGRKEKTVARLFFEKGIKLFSYTDEMHIRDKYMSNKISILMKHSMNKRFLHICGWQHLQDPYGLYAPFNPVKVFSNDKAICI